MNSLEALAKANIVKQQHDAIVKEKSKLVRKLRGALARGDKKEAAIYGRIIAHAYEFAEYLNGRLQKLTKAVGSVVRMQPTRPRA